MAFICRNLTGDFYRAGYGDAFGPELVIGIFNAQTTEYHGGFVGDNTSLCPSELRVWNGGIRFETNSEILAMPPLRQLERLFKHLARPMTLKLVGGCYPQDEELPFSLWMGGKAKMVQGNFKGTRNEFIFEWTRAMSVFMLPDGRPLLGGWYIGGADAGICEDELALICGANGSDRCVTGGPGYYQYEKRGITGKILLHAARVLCEEEKILWDGKIKIGIWGFGNVGKGVAMGLGEFRYRGYQGPQILAVSNKKAPKEKGVFSFHGLSPEELLCNAEDSEFGIARLVNEEKGIYPYTPGDEFSMSYINMLFLAAAREDAIHTGYGAGDAHSVAAHWVLSGTNSGITRDAHEVLFQRRKVAPPDFMVNMGAASTAKSSWHGFTDKECVAYAVRAVEKNLSLLFRKSKKYGRSMNNIAVNEVYSRLGRPQIIF